MGFSKQYFNDETDTPAPLTAVANGRVRFQEVDSIRIAWHGHYASYFEDGRIAFGDRYGMRYQDFQANRTPAPIVQLHCDYKKPLIFGDYFTVETSLHWSDAARINFSYIVKNGQKEVCATGYSVQLLTTIKGEMLLFLPDWLEEFRDYWRSGAWKKGSLRELKGEAI